MFLVDGQMYFVISCNWVEEIDVFDEVIIVCIVVVGYGQVVEGVFFGVVMSKMDGYYVNFVFVVGVCKMNVCWVYGLKGCIF